MQDDILNVAIYLCFDMGSKLINRNMNFNANIIHLMRRMFFITIVLCWIFPKCFGQVTGISNIPTGNSLQKPALSDSAIVYVSFVVETSGKITDVQAYKVSCKKCSKEFKQTIKSEAVRVIGSSQNMQPRNKRTRMLQPIKFVIEND